MPLFAPLDQMNSEEVLNANVRPFVGDGTSYLFVPGLKSVSSVRVGTVAIPLIERRKVPVNQDHSDHITIPFPLVDLQFSLDGQSVLLRAELSNDGIWQKGVNIYVGGEWEDGSEVALETEESQSVLPTRRTRN